MLSVLAAVNVLALAATLLSGHLLSPSSPVHAAQPSKGPLKVVLIGDSYSSGTGLGPRGSFGPGSRKTDPAKTPCRRNKGNWAQLYVDHLKEQGYNARLTNGACHGAVIGDVLNDKNLGVDSYPPRDLYLSPAKSCPDPTYPDDERLEFVGPSSSTLGEVDCRLWRNAQIDYVDEDTDIVLFTLGGNDILFRDIVTGCFLPPSRDRCKRAVDFANSVLGDDEKPIHTVRDLLKDVIAGLQIKAPDAKLVLVGYPFLVENGHEIDGYESGTLVRAIGRRGDREQRAAVLSSLGAFDSGTSWMTRKLKTKCAREEPPIDFLSARVFYVAGEDVKVCFSGHEPKGVPLDFNAGGWLNELADLAEEGKIDQEELWHPNSLGHAALRDILVPYGAFGAGNGGDGERSQASIDVVFAIDSTGSMGDDIDAVRKYASRFVRRLTEGSRSYRVAVVTYRDFDERTGDTTDYPSHTELGFTTDERQILASIEAIVVDGGGDTPESVYSGLQEAIGLPWRNGVKKVVIQLGDAPPLDPEPQTGLTAEDIIRSAREVDPAEVYGVDVSSSGADTGARLAEVAGRTGGRVVAATSPETVERALEGIVSEAASKPFAWVGGPYLSRVGEAVMLDGGGSFDSGGEIVRYEWDVDGDGSYDRSTSRPEVTQVFSGEFDGVVGLRVTDREGLSSEATAIARATVDGDEIEERVDNCPTMANGGQGDFDSDGLGDACDPQPGFGVEGVSGPSSDTPVAIVGASVIGVAILIMVGLALRGMGRSGRREHSRFSEDGDHFLENRNPRCRCGSVLAADMRFCDNCGAPRPAVRGP